MKNVTRAIAVILLGLFPTVTLSGCGDSPGANEPKNAQDFYPSVRVGSKINTGEPFGVCEVLEIRDEWVLVKPALEAIPKPTESWINLNKSGHYAILK